MRRGVVYLAMVFVKFPPCGPYATVSGRSRLPGPGMASVAARFHAQSSLKGRLVAAPAPRRKADCSRTDRVTGM